MRLSIQATGKTDVGCVRANNEDRFDFNAAHGIFVVCDGMGGQAAGEVASRIAVESVLDYFGGEPGNGVPALPATAPPGERLREAILFANNRIFETAQRNPHFNGMGSTIVAARANGQDIWIGHVGDSRAYVIRGGAIRQLTDDHSLVMEQVRRGLLTPEEAERSQMHNIITRALGAQGSVDVDVQQFTPQPGDLLLLSSDGLTRHVKDPAILRIIESAPSLEQACQALVVAARDGGGEDNITCLLLRVEKA